MFLFYLHGSLQICVIIDSLLKVMCFLEHHQVEFTMPASLKGGLETIGGMAVLLFFLSQHLEFSLHWHALSELVNSWTVED